ncbi:hypothetical protein ACFLZ6_00085 [Nanoarchaeota archaeon]
MKKETLEQFKGRTIKLVLKTGFYYTCSIDFLDDDAVHVLDKFNQRHVFALEQIAEVNELPR